MVAEMVLSAKGERNRDKPDHGSEEREEPRFRHAVVEELHPDESVVEKPQVVVPCEKQGEADEPARRVIEWVSLRLCRFRDSFLGGHADSPWSMPDGSNTFRAYIQRANAQDAILVLF